MAPGTLELLVSPVVMDWWREHGKRWGPAIAGGLFGAGWWFWVDAVAVSSTHKPFSQYLPGIVATLSLIMINSVRRDELLSYDPYDEGTFCRSRFWLLMAYGISLAAIGGSVVVMLHTGGSVASIMQVACILGAALVLFTSRSEGEGGGGGYEGF
ncbi:transmembrane 50-like protein [Micractinium conductrix]|uniref:Transmembrane 50-like protein n=1 Tax=Micractinium conductrix TaxID=554055 RepID=A0A2P6VII6_9CHLO|nr:transmembrane 50-like protein [Micractinium conductrix]|eukprot:PSC73905.1 transmembrane 50-like protein [Micractinium conductrix]